MADTSDQKDATRQTVETIQCVDVDCLDISGVLSAAEEFATHWGDYLSFVSGPGRANWRLVSSLTFDVLMWAQLLKAEIDKSGLIVPASSDQILLRFGPEALAEKGFAPNLPLRGHADKVDGLSMLISGITEFLATPEKIREFSRGKILLLKTEEQINFSSGAVAEINSAISRLRRITNKPKPD